MFTAAKLVKSFLRLAIMGPAGAGKTYTALQIATGFGGKIAVLDTEGGSAAKYADRYKFDIEVLSDHNPANFIRAIQEAQNAGYTIIILDSISHEWVGRGGCLERNTDIHAPKVQGNTYIAWGKTGKEHQLFLDAILNTPINIIATLRQKMGYEQTEENGKKKVVKLGLQPVQRDGAEYEFDTVWEMDQAHNANVTKDRSGFLQDEILAKPGPDIGAKLRAWLDRGEDAPVPVAPPAPTPPPVSKPLPPPAKTQAPIPQSPPPVTSENLDRAAQYTRLLATMRQYGDLYDGFDNTAATVKTFWDVESSKVMTVHQISLTITALDLAIGQDKTLAWALKETVGETGTPEPETAPEPVPLGAKRGRPRKNTEDTGAPAFNEEA